MIAQIDQLLPQTQCGLCGYGGCKPYATAIAEQSELINRCPPGGMRVLQQLGELLQQDITPYTRAMQAQEKAPSLAVIREDECIGCMKCIKVCPIDAIVGAPKLMHTVLADVCTGCELCIEPCPVDCIDMLEMPSVNDETLLKSRADKSRWRYQRRNLRMAAETSSASLTASHATTPIVNDRKTYVLEALARTQAKKQGKPDA